MGKSNNDNMIMFRLNKEQYDKLKELSAKTGLSVNLIVKDIIKRYMERI